MDLKSIKENLASLKKEAKKRNFSQTVDVIINLKDIDIKKVENQVEFFMSLPHGYGKSIKPTRA